MAASDLESSLSASKWSTRRDAYAELAKAFEAAADDSDPVYSQFAPALVKAVADSNEMARKEGVNAAAAFFRTAGLAVARGYAADITAGIVSTAFKSKRCVEPAKSALLDALTAGPEVLEAVVEIVLTKGFTHKTPKVVEAAVIAVKDAVLAFGRVTFAIGDILKAVAPLFSHAARPVRKEALELAASRSSVSKSGRIPWLARAISRR